MHKVAPKHEPLAATLDDENRVPWRVTARRERAHARDQIRIAIERTEPAGIDIWTHRNHRTLEKRLRIGRRGLKVLRAEPVVGLTLVSAHDRVLKDRLAVRGQTSHVIRNACG